MLATLVMFIHSRKTRVKPLPRVVCNFVTHRIVWTFILEPPIELIELWTEYGIISETRLPESTNPNSVAEIEDVTTPRVERRVSVLSYLFDCSPGTL